MRLSKILNVSFNISVLFFGICGSMLFWSRIQIQIQNTNNIFFKTQTSGQKKNKNFVDGICGIFCSSRCFKGELWMPLDFTHWAFKFYSSSDYGKRQADWLDVWWPQHYCICRLAKAANICITILPTPRRPMNKRWSEWLCKRVNKAAKLHPHLSSNLELKEAAVIFVSHPDDLTGHML